MYLSPIRECSLTPDDVGAWEACAHKATSCGIQRIALVDKKRGESPLACARWLLEHTALEEVVVHCSAQHHSLEACEDRVTLAHAFPKRCRLLVMSGSRPRKTRNALHLLAMCAQAQLRKVYAAYVSTRTDEIVYRKHKQSVCASLCPVLQIATDVAMLTHHRDLLAQAGVKELYMGTIVLTPSVVAALRFRMWKGVQIDEDLLAMSAHIPQQDRYAYLRDLSSLRGVHEYAHGSLRVAPFIEGWNITDEVLEQLICMNLQRFGRDAT